MSQRGCSTAVQWVLMHPASRVSQSNSSRSPPTTYPSVCKFEFTSNALPSATAPPSPMLFKPKLHAHIITHQHRTNVPTTTTRILTPTTTYSSVCKLEFTSNALPSATAPPSPMLLSHKLHAHIITHQHRTNVSTTTRQTSPLPTTPRTLGMWLCTMVMPTRGMPS